MRHEKNKPSKKEQRIYLPNPKKFNDLPAEKQLEELSKNIPKKGDRQREAIRQWNQLSHDRQWALIDQCDCIKRHGMALHALPGLLVERSIEGKKLRPIKSFDHWLIPISQLTENVHPEEIRCAEFNGTTVRFLEVLN